MGDAKILIVEDEQIIQLDIQDRLRESNHEVVAVAVSGLEAIEKARATRPDLIIMDIRLQGEMDGIEAAVRIRLEQNTPIIYLTASTDIRNLGRGAGTEPYFYLVKPVRTHDLLAMVETALHRENTASQIRDLR